MKITARVASLLLFALACAGSSTPHASMYVTMNAAAVARAHRPPTVTPAEVAGVRVFLDPEPQLPSSDFATKSFVDRLVPKLQAELAARGFVVATTRPEGAALVRIQSVMMLGADHVQASIWMQLSPAITSGSWSYFFDGGTASHPDAADVVAAGLVDTMLSEARTRDVVGAYKRLAIAAPPDKDAATALYKEANDLRDAGDVTAALPKYKAAFEQAHTPVLALALAKAYAATHHLVDARAVALSLPSIPVQPGESELTNAARTEAAVLAQSLDTRVPRLTLRATGIAPKVVLVDDAALPAGLFEMAVFSNARVMCASGVCSMLIDPGTHVLVTQYADGARRRAELHVTEGEKKMLSLP